MFPRSGLEFWVIIPKVIPLLQWVQNDQFHKQVSTMIKTSKKKTVKARTKLTREDLNL
jgi:hypothetical protein